MLAGSAVPQQAGWHNGAAANHLAEGGLRWDNGRRLPAVQGGPNRGVESFRRVFGLRWHSSTEFQGHHTVHAGPQRGHEEAELHPAQ
jgi:hypothetical protein